MRIELHNTVDVNDIHLHWCLGDAEHAVIGELRTLGSILHLPRELSDDEALKFATMNFTADFAYRLVTTTAGEVFRPLTMEILGPREVFDYIYDDKGEPVMIGDTQATKLNEDVVAYKAKITARRIK